MSGPSDEKVLGRGRFLELRVRNGWEWVERPKVSEIVVIFAVTPEGEAVLVEQYREPLQARVIEWPAGLVGDEEGYDEEHMLDAANRELEEETGYRAGKLTVVTHGPPSAGITSEHVHFLVAEDLEKVGEGGGVEGENITVHHVPLPEIEPWLQAREKEGLLIDPKVFTGLYFVAKQRA